MLLEQTRRRPFRLILALAALAPTLGGCYSDQAGTTGSIYPEDYRDRHPIVLGNSERTLDLFTDSARGLDMRERRDLADYVEEYRRHGTGPIVAQVPVGTGAATHRTLETIRGAAGGRLAVSSYRPADPTMASPVRLSFKRLQAKVADKCGLWPQDLGVSDVQYSDRNQQYWNMGCAYQNTLASQVADPLDLVRGRHETPPDTARRMYSFGQIRRGQDPSTQYKQNDAKVDVSSSSSQ